MQTKKLSLKKILAIALCAVVCAVAFAVPFAMQQKSVDNVSAAGNCSIAVTFAGFQTEKIAPYTVVSFTYMESGKAKTVSEIATSSKTTVTLPINGLSGKLEINCPLYSKISVPGQTDLKGNIGATASSYATCDFTSVPANLQVAVTFNDKGWFASTTIY
mgnify:CR=1 FL=1